MSAQMTDISWTVHIMNLLGAMSLLALIDHTIVRAVVANAGKLGERDARSARWFFIHAFANALIAATAIPSMGAVLRDPLHAMDSTVHTGSGLFDSASVWPLTILNAVHIYHVVGGFKLSAPERFHHLVFIPTLGFPGQVFRWGALSNWQAFFISGFPGMIDYFLLGMQKIGKCKSLTEKRVNANLNVWCRGPGIGGATVLLYQALVYGKLQVPLWAAILQLVLPPYNAMYYGKQAVANYSVHYMLDLLGQDELIKKHLEERTSVTTGTQVMAWKDALGVPQRGS